MKFALRAIASDPADVSRRWLAVRAAENVADVKVVAEQCCMLARLSPGDAKPARKLSMLISERRLPKEVDLDLMGLCSLLDHNTADRDLLAALALDVLARQGPWASALRMGRRSGWSRAAEVAIAGAGRSLVHDELLHTTMRSGVVAHSGFERLLTAVRARMAIEIEPSRLLDLPCAPLAVAIARQCRLNGHVWSVSTEEARAAADNLSSLRDIDATASDWLARLLACSLYHPLHEIMEKCTISEEYLLEMASGSRVGDARASAATALAADVAEDRQLRLHASRMPCLGPVDDAVSMAVAEQYSESPYPRWNSVLTFEAGEYLPRLAEVLPEETRKMLSGRFDVLIAGCGTGRQAVSAALDYGPDVHVVGIDITQASLGYAAMMSERMDTANLELLRADIDRLPEVAPGFVGRFGVIECVGVLHHMADPYGAWRKLRGLLAPRGLMTIGLYSSTARANLEVLRRSEHYPGPGCSIEALRTFRRHLIDLSDGAPGTEFRAIPDFYSSNGFRDLFLHVNERVTTLAEIETFLDANGLEFRGFVDIPFEMLKAHTPNAIWPGRLSQWARLEAERPRLFKSMYQFFCVGRRAELPAMDAI